MTHRDPRVLTVLIACLNGGELLRRQLESLTHQELDRPWEIVLADNGSTDDSVQIAMSFHDRLPIRVMDASAHPGQAAALNSVLPEVRGGQLVILDADDEVAPGYLLAMARALDAHTFVGARLDSQRLNDEALRRRRGDMQTDGLPLFMRGYLPFVVGSTMGVSTRAFEQVGGFRRDFLANQDVDLSWRLQYAGHAPHFVPDAVLHYRYRDTLRGIYRQERQYGTYEALLYREHRPLGMPRRRVMSTARAWIDLAIASLGAFSDAGRARLATRAGMVVGRLRGSRRFGVWYL